MRPTPTHAPDGKTAGGDPERLAGSSRVRLTIAEMGAARGYRKHGMAAYSEARHAEFAAGAERYTATRHRREPGVGYLGAAAMAISGGRSSTTALCGSTEAARFHDDARSAAARDHDGSGAQSRLGRRGETGAETINVQGTGRPARALRPHDFPHHPEAMDMATAITGYERSVWLPTWPRLTAPEALRPVIGAARNPPAPSGPKTRLNDHGKTRPAGRPIPVRDR